MFITNYIHEVVKILCFIVFIRYFTYRMQKKNYQITTGVVIKTLAIKNRVKHFWLPISSRNFLLDSAKFIFVHD